MVASPEGSDAPLRRRSSVHILVQSAWPQAITVCSVLGVTFVVFPGVVAAWQPSSRVTYVIATFQLLDVIGRSAPEIEFLKIRHGPTVSALAALRVLFIPLFMFIQRENSDLTKNMFVQFGAMILFAFTNGYVSTLSMTLGPSQRGLAQDERQPVGTMMSFFLCFGIFAGSLLALPTQIGLPPAAQHC